MLISSTYANAPYISFDALSDDYNCIIAGVEYDVKSSFHTGAKYAPRKIREFGFLNKYSFEHDLDVTRYIRLADAGNIPISPCDLEENIFNLIEDYVLKIIKSKAYPIILGGDRSITYAEIKSYYDVYGPITALFLGAHSGLNDSVFFDELSVVRKCIEENMIDCESSAILGTRELFFNKNEHSFAQKNNILVISIEDILKNGVSKTAEILKKRISNKNVFVATCVDIADVDCAPGVSSPIPLGISSFDLFELLRGSLTGKKIIGCDVTGCLGGFDLTRKTELFASSIVNEFIAIFASFEAGKEEYLLSGDICFQK